MREHAADEIGDEIGPERPAGTQISERPNHVRNTGVHHTAVGDGVGKIERRAIDLEGDVTERAEMKAGRGDDNAGQVLCRPESIAAVTEALCRLAEAYARSKG